MGKGQCSKISPSIIQMILHPTRRNPQKLRNILHRLAIRDPLETLPLALGQGTFLLTVPGRAPDSGGVHMRMIGESQPFQHVLRGLDETIESKAAVVHR